MSPKWIVVVVLLLTAGTALATAPESGQAIDFPRDLQSYDDGAIESITGRLASRAKAQP